MNNTYLYILIMAGVTYLIRTLPLTLIRRPIRNRFLCSFLYYVPYVTLAVMTFPAILHATQSPWAGLGALIAGGLASFLGAKMFQVAGISCITVFFLEWILI